MKNFTLTSIFILCFVICISCSHKPDIEEKYEVQDTIVLPKEPDEIVSSDEPENITGAGIFDRYVIDNDILISTGIPLVSIQTENNQEIQNKEDWIPAIMTIDGAEDSFWNIDELIISIRGRGNSTWGQAKKPFAIKLEKKQSVLGMPKHKRWVLIANYLDNSFMKNVVAFDLSKKLGLDYTVRGEYVNLVLNGNYIGLYWLGEAIKIDSNRVNIDAENDYLIEMDVYYDEVWKFKSKIKELPYMIKNDDNMSEEKLTILQNGISDMEDVLYSEYFPYTDESKLVYDERYKDYIDINSFAKFYLVNEIMYNGELCHPKSSYFTFDSQSGILHAGPVWDFDWAAYSNSNSLILNETIYYDALFKIPDFQQELNSLLLLISSEEISEDIDRVQNKIKASVELDSKRWGTENRNPVGEAKNSFDEYVAYLKDCVITRIDFMKDNQL